MIKTWRRNKFFVIFSSFRHHFHVIVIFYSIWICTVNFILLYNLQCLDMFTVEWQFACEGPNVSISAHLGEQRFWNEPRDRIPEQPVRRARETARALAFPPRFSLESSFRNTAWYNRPRIFSRENTGGWVFTASIQSTSSLGETRFRGFGKETRVKLILYVPYDESAGWGISRVPGENVGDFRNALSNSQSAGPTGRTCNTNLTRSQVQNEQRAIFKYESKLR